MALPTTDGACPLEKPSTMRDRMLTLLGHVVADADSIDFRAVGKFPGGRAVA